MTQFELSSQDYSFSSANPLACEGAFYSFANQLALSKSSGPDASTHLSTFVKLINQVSGSLHAFCQLPPIQKGSDLLSPAGTSIMRGESHGLPYLAFKSCIQVDQTNTCDKTVLTLAMKKDFSWEKTLFDASIPPTHFNLDAEKTNLNKFLEHSRSPITFNGFKKPISFLGDRKMEFNNSCELKILGQVTVHGISPKVSQFIIQTLGGIGKLCKLHEMPYKSGILDSLNDAFYATPKTIYRLSEDKGQAFEVGFRLCEVVSGLQANGSWKSVCASDTKYMHEKVRKLQKTLGKDSFTGRSSVPFFIFARVDKQLKDLTISIYNSDIQRSASNQDLSALTNLARSQIYTFPSLRGNLVRISLAQMHLDEPFNEEDC